MLLDLKLLTSFLLLMLFGNNLLCATIQIFFYSLLSYLEKHYYDF